MSLVFLNILLNARDPFDHRQESEAAEGGGRNHKSSSRAGKFVSTEKKYRGKWSFLSNVDKFCSREILYRDALKAVVLISWIYSVC